NVSSVRHVGDILQRTMMWLFITVTYLICTTDSSSASPEVSMDVGEIVRYHGYPYEEHEVVTEDGYYLTLQRIPHGRDNSESTTPKPAVLLQHGLVLEGSNWVTNLPNRSLGFILADAGYDVWIGNSRGNSWSRKHKEFEFYSEKYSSYSFHEMAMYDLPATINYILQKTGQEQLYYVAYSQGTTTGFIAFSSIPELDHKIKMFFALAPITTSSNMKSPLVRVFDLPEGLIKVGSPLTLLWFHRQNLFLKQVTSRLCGYTFFKSFCSLVLYLPGGFTNSLNVVRILQITQCGCAVGKRTVSWSHQLLDMGQTAMLFIFQSTPPFYELENMKAPLAAWFGGRDWISAPEDVNITLPRITNVAYKKYIPEFVHFDFLWGVQAYEQIYKEMLELMKKNA
uniref:Lipase n=1 Tax=Coturnix japonica TaxID=93934 RepID=A0A8C2TQI9_COTJA